MSIFPEKNVPQCEEILGYQFNDKSLCASALNASGTNHILHGTIIKPNKRLATYGDTAMTQLMCAKWLDTDRTLGDWADIRSTTLASKNLGEIGTSAGIDKAAVFSGGTTTVSDKMMASVVQAIMGAVHLDAGMHAEQVLGTAMSKIGLENSLLQPESAGISTETGGLGQGQNGQDRGKSA
ncbi:uncharacterized protein HMPREF1541_03390 [Cyphellophora europaea CBS 101466]|uniref:RNase III domain-containing protein n=1 Tax=Cyphellophora europaea (strain CBS 101466) TaxID=1220924 RepID=W2S0J6_CYPE1|nr:uncharacterized protein HMPREF1541_03390 [Cyphellophora europaea CBS 101466]ETN41454.1 hypothetical protein HMPREF1541_03390 [Cyphellophora europaea CBS 101466]